MFEWFLSNPIQFHCLHSDGLLLFVVRWKLRLSYVRILENLHIEAPQQHLIPFWIFSASTMTTAIGKCAYHKQVIVDGIAKVSIGFLLTVWHICYISIYLYACHVMSCRVVCVCVCHMMILFVSICGLVCVDGWDVTSGDIIFYIVLNSCMG